MEEPARHHWRYYTALITLTVFLFVIRSGECQQHQQYFTEKPLNTSVREGQMAVLRCKVGNQQGRAQWTKDGFALGFERTIPSFPRYTVMGSEEQGEHHMRIENATLDDDAEYQCQVGPRGLSKPIRADARLTVLIPPNSVEILDHPPGARIQSRENEELVLQCLVRNAKPAADIVWFKRNVELKYAQVENTTMESELPRRFDTRSKLTIRAMADDNAADYTCEARHPALIAPKRASVTLNVQYPPGPPEITGYTEGETVRMGQDVSLECISRGGNPLAQVVWYKNEVRIDHTYETTARESRNVYQFRAEAGDNNARFRCEASNLLSVSPMKAEVTLTVHFPPKQVTVKVRPEKLRPGTPATLTCESGTSNPVSRLTWLRGNGQPLPAAANSTSPGQYSGLVTKSTLTLDVTPDFHGSVITCKADNGIGPQIHDAITLEVLYKPQFAKTGEYTVDVVEGQPAVVNMTARANPSEVTYSWSRAGSAIKQAKDATEYDRISFDGPLLNLSTVRRDDKGDYKCDATNAEGTQTITVKLNVQYPASIVSARSVVMVREGSDATLECQATGNPLTATMVSWRRAGFDMEGRTVLSSAPGMASLYVKNISRQDTGAFECVADNGIGGESVEKTWLVATYKPVMDDSPQLTKAAGDEGQLAKLICRAQGAPNITFGWSREGVPLTNGDKYTLTTTQVDIVTWESTLQVASVRSRDYGQYDCIARNEMGTNTAKVVLSGTSRPDPPLLLHALNVSHDAVDLAWRPGFDGGLPQAYRIRYRQVGTEFFKYADVYPANVTSFTLGGLALGTEYLFGIMAFNDLGESNYTMDLVKARTSSPYDEANLLSDPLFTRGDSPQIVIIAVSAAGSVLLILNIVLVACYLARRRKKKAMEEAMSSEGGSSKSATIEMYAPSSYNETVNGETLSSISEKSEAYSQNGSHSDYAPEDASKAAVSTYLIDQVDGQVAYGSYRVATGNQVQTAVHGTLSRPPKTVNFDMGEDNYIDTLRRNAAFAQGNYGTESMYGKSRMASPMASNQDSYYNPSPINDPGRYGPVPPAFHHGSNRYNPLHETSLSAVGHHAAANPATSPYTPMGSLNIPAANGIYGPVPSGRVSAGLPVNLPLPLPMSMQQGHGHGHFTSFNPSEGPSPVMEATAQFSGPSLATVRSLETEGHLV